MRRIFALVKEDNLNLSKDQMVEILPSDPDNQYFIDSFINSGPNTKVNVKVRVGEFLIYKKYLYSYWFV
jgi:hypothetical protein